MDPKFKKMRGSYAIPLTPFTDDDRLDVEVLEKELETLLEWKVATVIGPIMMSEFESLSEAERRTYVDVMVSVLKDRVPIIANCAAVNANLAVSFAEYCEKKGVDMLIAMPPYITHTLTYSNVVDYYTRIHNATSLPIMVQNSERVKLSPAQLAELMEKLPRVRWVKHEVLPPSRSVTELFSHKKAAELVDGVVTGAGGLYLISDWLRGAVGCAHGCEYADVVQRIWNLLDEEKQAEAEELFCKIMPALSHERTYGAMIYGKYIMMKRGIFKNYYCRMAQTQLTAEDIQDIELVWKMVEPLLQ